LAAYPKDLIAKPDADPGLSAGDVLSNVLRQIRLSGSLQFCFMPQGAWQTDDKPAFASQATAGARPIPFHIVVAGECWLKMEGRHVALEQGDVVAFPFGTGHQLGVGSNGTTITPTKLLPPKPWRQVPILHHGQGAQQVRLLCGYLQCDIVNFRPLRDALPRLLHVRSGKSADAAWLRATIDQIAAEVDKPRSGGLSMLERLSEITFIELLRHEIMMAPQGATGWLAALADPGLRRSLSLIHDDPARGWTLTTLARDCGVSKSTLAERFDAILGTSPISYLRDWRLYLASVELSGSTKSIARIAEDAGYGTEAAFSRAFARNFGSPPAAWRRLARMQSSAP
jgi:AraC-like DNA-binding protein